ncbi:GNVR domain-containing protein [Paucibacter sp. DJ2R-2]|uniref:GNVR domain-containing protein n=1 Tax=Paucibacter sp. DJ2R-2 TaxID=2893558 RepID=UPI0021E37A1E|nr:GNVR domain-containing protein [Paucibacter sp. DJ2R-2]MCV2423098.1 lipopolysaccharide biosynthesis protein [Paucibacter sp. DJ4R-1]MCV2440994.1 lipopolysaccharide biosynthesis protein [Paucibacter sp. DJ2R-2]
MDTDFCPIWIRHRRNQNTDKVTNPTTPSTAPSTSATASASPLSSLVQKHWRVIAIAPIGIALLALPVSYLIPPTFTARTSFLPPQTPGGTNAAVASLGALANLAGGGGMKTPADQYVALMQSATVQERLIERFKLLEAYDVKLKIDARRELQQNVRASLSKRDGIIAVEVDDRSPERAAALANGHVEELAKFIATLAITEAQQRRVFFDNLLKTTQAKLSAAQEALQASGYNASALRAEPKAAAEIYAKLKAEITSAEARLTAAQQSLSSSAPEVMRQAALVATLRKELNINESSHSSTSQTDYITKYREFKYQETLFELFARQYETARVDEAREGGLLQVIDVAQPPEKKSAPKRSRVMIAAYFIGLAAAILWLLLRGRRPAPLSNQQNGQTEDAPQVEQN